MAPGRRRGRDRWRCRRGCRKLNSWGIVKRDWRYYSKPVLKQTMHVEAGAAGGAVVAGQGRQRLLELSARHRRHGGLQQGRVQRLQVAGEKILFADDGIKSRSKRRAAVSTP